MVNFNVGEMFKGQSNPRFITATDFGLQLILQSIKQSEKLAFQGHTILRLFLCYFHEIQVWSMSAHFVFFLWLDTRSFILVLVMVWLLYPRVPLMFLFQIMFLFFVTTSFHLHSNLVPVSVQSLPLFLNLQTLYNLFSHFS